MRKAALAQTLKPFLKHSRYIARKATAVIAMTIESPTPTFPRHYGLTAKILKSLSKEA